MADLIDRISGASVGQIPSRPKLNVHRFIGVERLYAFGEWTRAQIATEFDLQGAEATQATQLANRVVAEITHAELLNQECFLRFVLGLGLSAPDETKYLEVRDTVFNPTSSSRDGCSPPEPWHEQELEVASRSESVITCGDTQEEND